MKIETESELIKYGFIEHYVEWKRQTTDLVCNLPVVSFEKWWNENIIESEENCVLHIRDVIDFVKNNYKNNKIDKKVSKKLFKENKGYRSEILFCGCCILIYAFFSFVSCRVWFNFLYMCW